MAVRHFAAGIVLAAAMTLGAAAKDSDVKTAPPEGHSPPATFSLEHPATPPDRSLMSTAEQCQWECYRAATDCARTQDGAYCQSTYNQCVSYCGG